MPDRSKVMTQTERDALIIHAWGVVFDSPTPLKVCSVEKLLKFEDNFGKG